MSFRDVERMSAGLRDDDRRSILLHEHQIDAGLLDTVARRVVRCRALRGARLEAQPFAELVVERELGPPPRAKLLANTHEYALAELIANRDARSDAGITADRDLEQVHIQHVAQRLRQRRGHYPSHHRRGRLRNSRLLPLAKLVHWTIEHNQ